MSINTGTMSLGGTMGLGGLPAAATTGPSLYDVLMKKDDTLEYDLSSSEVKAIKSIPYSTKLEPFFPILTGFTRTSRGYLIKLALIMMGNHDLVNSNSKKDKFLVELSSSLSEEQRLTLVKGMTKWNCNSIFSYLLKLLFEMNCFDQALAGIACLDEGVISETRAHNSDRNDFDVIFTQDLAENLPYLTMSHAQKMFQAFKTLTPLNEMHIVVTVLLKEKKYEEALEYAGKLSPDIVHLKLVKREPWSLQQAGFGIILRHAFQTKNDELASKVLSKGVVKPNTILEERIQVAAEFAKKQDLAAAYHLLKHHVTMKTVPPYNRYDWKSIYIETIRKIAEDHLKSYETALEFAKKTPPRDQRTIVTVISTMISGPIAEYYSTQAAEAVKKKYFQVAQQLCKTILDTTLRGGMTERVLDFILDGPRDEKEADGDTVMSQGAGERKEAAEKKG